MKKLFTYLFPPMLLVFGITLHGLHGEAGAAAVDFTLNDVNGKSLSLSGFKQARAVAVIFISTRCPVSNAYNGRMEELHKKYKKANIVFLGINSNKMEGIDEIKSHASENGLTFTILKDPGNKTADQLKASFTPEVYVFNGKGEILYHGRIDDSRRLEKVTANEFKDALDAVVAGKPVPVKETKAFGCSIKRVKK